MNIMNGYMEGILSTTTNVADYLIKPACNARVPNMDIVLFFMPHQN